MTNEESSDNSGVFSKTEFNQFVKDTLSKGDQIKSAYIRLIEGTSDSVAVIDEIEEKLLEIQNQYKNLFDKDPVSSTSKISSVNAAIKNIQDWHLKLIEGSEEEVSVKDKILSAEKDILEAQKGITIFYTELFGGSETDDGGKEAELNTAIEEVTSFYTDVTKEGGYKAVVEAAYDQITQYNDDLFVTKDEDGNTKVSKTNAEIVNISEFSDKLETDIAPFIKATQEDIDTKRNDVGRLLGSAIGPSLLQGYLDSKNEYKRIPKYEKLNGDINDLLVVVPINLFRLLQNIIGLVVDHVFFIVPLLMSVAILIQFGDLSEVLGVQLNDTFLKNMDFIDRLLVSLPLWWISLFGYKNIRNKNHLSEEYNHKAQVTRMYIKFTSEEDSEKYPIADDARIRLDHTLISTIDRNPSEIYRKDDTIMDKMAELVLVWKGGCPVKEEDNEQEVPQASQKPVKKVAAVKKATT